MHSYQKLIVWQKSVLFVTEIYENTKSFPKEEAFSLTNQIRRCVISIASNIAEGYQRQSRKEFVQFLYISYGGCAELYTQLVLARNLKYISEQQFITLSQQLSEIEKMLNVLTRKLKVK